MSTDSFYKGQTRDINERLKRHNSDRNKSTKAGMPWIVVWFTKKNSRSEAIRLEAKLKNLSRAKTLVLIKKYSSDCAGPDDHA